MRINVAQLLKEPTGATRSFELDDTICSEQESEHRVQGKGQLLRAAKSILVRGTFTSKGNLVCSRCLTLFSYPLAFKIEEEFYPSVDIINGEPLSLPDDSTASVIDERHILDLTEVIRQHILLAVPMKPLCHTNCAGLCPQCGANLNETTCHCTRNRQTAFAVAFEKLKSTRKSR